jgi:hypothetical protein
VSGLLALGEEVRPLAWNPLPTAPRTAAERFQLSLEAQLATGNFASEERNLRLAFDEAAAALREAGAQVENPYEAGEFQGAFLTDLGSLARRVILPNASVPLAAAQAELRRRRELAWDQAVSRLREERPEEAERYLYSHEVREMARRRAQNAAAEAAAAEGLGGGLGGFLGSMAGIFADPIQVMTLPLGAGRMAGTVLAQVARTALIEGAVAGATQAVVETRAGPYRQSLGLPDDSLAQVGMAALGGAVIGGGLRALALGAERLRARLPPTDPARVAAQDAATLVQTRILDEAAAPGAPELVPAHEAALAAGIRRVETPEAPPVPELPPPGRRVPIQDLDGAAPDTVRAQVAAALDAPPGSGSFALGFGALPDEVAARIRTQTGLDVRGLVYVMQRDELRHVWRRHGPEGDDIRVRPLTLEDLANLPRWLREADRFRHDGATHQGLPVLRAEKDLPDGTLVIVETVRAARGLLALKTAYFARKGGGPGTAGSSPAPGAPPPLRPERGPGAAAQNLSSNLKEFNAYTPTGRAVLVEPRVVSLRRLIPSHDPDGRPNPAYPHAEGLQPRDRSAAPSQDQVRAIAARLVPERLLPNVEAGMGAPIIGPDLVVESGNARVAALTLVHRDPALARVREAYLAALERAGFDLAGIEEPVLVSARITQMTPAERVAFVREANLRGTAAETLTETAARDADAVRGLMTLWRGGAVDAAANAEFLRGFLARLTAEERTALLDRAGRPLPALVQRIERALLAAAYGDALGPLAARLIAGDTEGLRGLAAALRNVAGDWAAMRAEIAAGRVPAEYEATAALAEAVSAIAEAQARRLKLDELVLQTDIERPGLTPAGLAMLRAMFPDGDLARRIKPEVRLTEMLRGYVQRARAADAGPMLLDLPPVRTEDAIARAAGAEDAAAARAGENSPPPDTPPAAAAARAAGETSPADPQAARLQAAAEEVRRLARDPATRSAELLEAQRIAAERDLPVPEETAQRGARELLDEAEAEAAEAAAAAACLIGGAA